MIVAHAAQLGHSPWSWHPHPDVWALVVFLPTTVFVDGRGRIVEQRTGELSWAELEQAIERAFGILA